VEAGWISCPSCGESLGGSPRRQNGSPDLDVRRDNTATTVVVAVLAALGVIGVAGVLWEASLFLSGPYRTALPMIYVFVGLLFLAALSTLGVFIRSGGRPGVHAVRRVIVGTLVIAGVLTALALAIVVFILVVCYAVPQGPHV
jgi:O-antigen/teichoic acid export membrane protein